ncbi:unnamed protein product [Ambrosiozyma monospora]|uniref:Unnamed protein product n=1 Tax=Ambrosiozyma monospora TaxID=43982 RepID=A0A9W7DFG4_AMBMO|nr:unnamed protein product [Ambrosiozyma monospora]
MREFIIKLHNIESQNPQSSRKNQHYLIRIPEPQIHLQQEATSNSNTINSINDAIRFNDYAVNYSQLPQLTVQIYQLTSIILEHGPQDYDNSDLRFSISKKVQVNTVDVHEYDDTADTVEVAEDHKAVALE